MAQPRRNLTKRQAERNELRYRFAPSSPEASRQEVVDAWFRAKAANPRYTQREFEIDALGRDPKTADGRYLRLVMEGKRSGRLLVREAYETPTGGVRNVFNVRVRDNDGNYHSFNISPDSDQRLSRLDVPVIEAQVANRPGIIAAHTAAWERRYHTSIPTGRYDVTRVVDVKAPITRVRV